MADVMDAAHWDALIKVLSQIAEAIGKIAFAIWIYAGVRALKDK